MTLDAAFADAATDLMAEFGATATYTPPSGVPVATLASVSRVMRMRADGVGIERVTQAILPAADVPAPAVGAYIAIGPATYVVDALVDAADTVVTVTVRAL